MKKRMIMTEVPSGDAIYVSKGSDMGDVCHLPFTLSLLHSPFTLVFSSASPSGLHLLHMSTEMLSNRLSLFGTADLNCSVPH